MDLVPEQLFPFIFSAAQRHIPSSWQASSSPSTIQSSCVAFAKYVKSLAGPNTYTERKIRQLLTYMPGMLEHQEALLRLLNVDETKRNKRMHSTEGRLLNRKLWWDCSSSLTGGGDQIQEAYDSAAQKLQAKIVKIEPNKKRRKLTHPKNETNFSPSPTASQLEADVVAWVNQITTNIYNKINTTASVGFDQINTKKFSNTYDNKVLHLAVSTILWQRCAFKPLHPADTPLQFEANNNDMCDNSQLKLPIFLLPKQYDVSNLKNELQLAAAARSNAGRHGRSERLTDQKTALPFDPKQTVISYATPNLVAQYGSFYYNRALQRRQRIGAWYLYNNKAACHNIKRPLEVDEPMQDERKLEHARLGVEKSKALSQRAVKSYTARRLVEFVLTQQNNSSSPSPLTTTPTERTRKRRRQTNFSPTSADDWLGHAIAASTKRNNRLNSLSKRKSRATITER